MKVKKLLWMFCLCSLGAMAENDPNVLSVWTKDGTKQVFALAELPSVSFTASEMLVKSKDVEVNYDLTQVARFTYEKRELAGVESLVDGTPAFNWKGDTLVFPYLKAKSRVAIYRMDGTLVVSRQVQMEGTYALPLQHLERGTYLVQANGLTFKMMRR